MLHYSHPFIYVLPIQGDAFLFGTFMGIGYFDNVLKKLNREVEILLGLACLAVSWSIPPITVLGYAMVVSYCFLAIGFSLLMDGINNSNLRIISFAFGDRLIRYLGKISFGLYVYHIAVFSIMSGLYIKYIMPNVLPFWKPGTRKEWAAYAFISLIVTILVAAISYELYEKQFLKLKRKFTVIQSRPL